MKVQELRQLTPKKLMEQLKKSRRTLAVTRFHVKTGQQQNTSLIKKEKKLIARILTLMKSERTVAEELPKEPIKE